MLIIDIIGWLIIGLIVGLLARMLVPGRDPMGCLATSILGIAGSFVGGWLSSFFWRPAPRGVYIRPGFLTSLLGAIIVLVIVRAVRRRP